MHTEVSWEIYLFCFFDCVHRSVYSVLTKMLKLSKVMIHCYISAALQTTKSPVSQNVLLSFWFCHHLKKNCHLKHNVVNKQRICSCSVSGVTRSLTEATVAPQVCFKLICCHDLESLSFGFTLPMHVLCTNSLKCILSSVCSRCRRHLLTFVCFCLFVPPGVCVYDCNQTLKWE